MKIEIQHPRTGGVLSRHRKIGKRFYAASRRAVASLRGIPRYVVNGTPMYAMDILAMVRSDLRIREGV